MTKTKQKIKNENKAPNEDDKFYPASNDKMFQAIFSREINEDVLQKLAEEALEEPLQIESRKLPTLPIANRRVKGKTVDVLVRDTTGRLINIEMNASTYPGLDIRNMAYIFEQYANDVKTRADEFRKNKNTYREMKDIVQINFTCGLGKDKPLKEIIKLRNERGEVRLRNLTIINYNVDKMYDEWYNTGESKYKFIVMLALGEEELKKISKGDELMEKFKDEIIKLNKNDEFVSFLTEEEDTALYISDKAFGLGLEQGIEKGIEQGLLEKAKETAKKMLDKNMDVKSISEITGLTKEQIEELQ